MPAPHDVSASEDDLHPTLVPESGTSQPPTSTAAVDQTFTCSWTRVIGNAEARPRAGRGSNWKKPPFIAHSEHQPVVLVSGNDAVAFCR